MSKFSEPTNLPGEWSDSSLAWLWHDVNPFAAKFAMEKMTGVLLQRDADDTLHLSYRGASTTGDHTRALRFGEDSGLQKFATDGEMLACLRTFFDWESRRGVHPHQPPEREVWQYIRSQLVKPRV